MDSKEAKRVEEEVKEETKASQELPPPPSEQKEEGEEKDQKEQKESEVPGGTTPSVSTPPTSSPKQQSNKTVGEDEGEGKETSPQGRYERTDVLLGSGAYKDVYQAFDTHEGNFVAWNVVKLLKIPQSERKRIRNEVKLLREIDHSFVIKYFSSWVNREKEEVIFITEIMSSGTLKEYIYKNQVISWGLAKRWFRELLRGLAFLHSNGIIHRDIKCDNIFVNGATGDIRIGDLGLSLRISEGRDNPTGTPHAQSASQAKAVISSSMAKQIQKAMTCLGTPEFMAPELYDELYDEKVDIYAFGMCALEIITQLSPFHEFLTAGQIYKAVLSGAHPPELELVQEEGAKQLILSCLAHNANNRPSAQELLDHNEFLNQVDEELDNRPIRNPFASENREDDTDEGGEGGENGLNSLSRYSGTSSYGSLPSDDELDMGRVPSLTESRSHPSQVGGGQQQEQQSGLGGEEEGGEREGGSEEQQGTSSGSEDVSGSNPSVTTNSNSSSSGEESVGEGQWQFTTQDSGTYSVQNENESGGEYGEYRGDSRFSEEDVRSQTLSESGTYEGEEEGTGHQGKEEDEEEEEEEEDFEIQIISQEEPFIKTIELNTGKHVVEFTFNPLEEKPNAIIQELAVMGYLDEEKVPLVASELKQVVREAETEEDRELRIQDEREKGIRPSSLLVRYFPSRTTNTSSILDIEEGEALYTSMPSPQRSHKVTATNANTSPSTNNNNNNNNGTNNSNNGTNNGRYTPSSTSNTTNNNNNSNNNSSSAPSSTPSPHAVNLEDQRTPEEEEGEVYTFALDSKAMLRRGMGEDEEGNTSSSSSSHHQYHSSSLGISLSPHIMFDGNGNTNPGSNLPSSSTGSSSSSNPNTSTTTTSSSSSSSSSSTTHGLREEVEVYFCLPDQYYSLKPQVESLVQEVNLLLEELARYEQAKVQNRPPSGSNDSEELNAMVSQQQGDASNNNNGQQSVSDDPKSCLSLAKRLKQITKRVNSIESRFQKTCDSTERSYQTDLEQYRRELKGHNKNKEKLVKKKEELEKRRNDRFKEIEDKKRRIESRLHKTQGTRGESEEESEGQQESKQQEEEGEALTTH